MTSKRVTLGLLAMTAIAVVVGYIVGSGAAMEDRGVRRISLAWRLPGDSRCDYRYQRWAHDGPDSEQY